jgi:hypothetical protein
MQQCDYEDFEDRRRGERRNLTPFCVTEDGVEIIAEKAAHKALLKLIGMFRVMWLIVAASFGVFIWLNKKGLL